MVPERNGNPHQRPRGYTLVELMVVVAIFTVLASIGARAFAGRSHQQEAARVARSIQYAVMRARTEAISDGVQRRLNCSPTSCAVEMAASAVAAAGVAPTPSLGMGAPVAWGPDGSTIPTGSTVQIYAMHNAVELTPVAAPSPVLAGNATVTLYPDGSARPPAGAYPGATIFVQDQSGNNKYKIVVFPTTGLARLVTSW